MEPAADPLPLGTFTTLPDTPSCQEGFRCQAFEVSDCSGLTPSAAGILAVGSPRGGAEPRGVVIFFGGSLGTGWWANTTRAKPFLDRLRRSHRFYVVQVKWVDSWLMAGEGEEAGTAHVACRPATVVDWVHRNLYLPLGLTPLPGECGFCVTGNSSGSSPPGYVLSHFALDEVLDAVVPTSGPTYAAIAKGCMDEPGYEWDEQQASRVDYTFGYLVDGTGPCALNDEAFVPRWDEESIDIGGSDYSHPSTRIEFVVGELDVQSAPNHAADYRDRLLQDASNGVTWTVVQGMGHTIQKSRAGLEALEAALLGSF